MIAIFIDQLIVARLKDQRLTNYRHATDQESHFWAEMEKFRRFRPKIGFPSSWNFGLKLQLSAFHVSRDLSSSMLNFETFVEYAIS